MTKKLLLVIGAFLLALNLNAEITKEEFLKSLLQHADDFGIIEGYESAFYKKDWHVSFITSNKHKGLFNRLYVLANHLGDNQFSVQYQSKKTDGLIAGKNGNYNQYSKKIKKLESWEKTYGTFAEEQYYEFTHPSANLDKVFDQYERFFP